MNVNFYFGCIIWNQGLIVQMYQAGLRGRILTATWNILTNRTAHCEVNGIKETVSCINIGTCQGSYSAAFFFNFVVRKMMEQVTRKKIKFSEDGNISSFKTLYALLNFMEHLRAEGNDLKCSRLSFQI